MNSVEVIFLVLFVLVMFTSFRLWLGWRKALINRLMSVTHSANRDYVVNRTVAGPYFHVQNSRPLGILFSLVGIVGLCATWIFAADWFPRIILTVFFVAFTVISLPSAIGGGCYRSRFDNGHVYWEYPSRFYGKNDSCRVTDIVELQQISSCSDSSIVTYCFLLKDGTKKRIRDNCFGDCISFIRALQEENPSIVFSEKSH
jgi:hypothetical protein